MVSALIPLFPAEGWACLVLFLITLLLYVSYYSLRTRLLKTILEQTPYPWAIINTKTERIVIKAKSFSRLLNIPFGTLPTLSSLLTHFKLEDQKDLKDWILSDGTGKLVTRTEKGTTLRLTKRMLTSHLVSIWFDDISASLAMEETLTATKTHAHQLQEILNALPFPVWAHDKINGRLLHINAAYAEFLAESAQTVLDKQTNLLKRSKQRTNEAGTKLYPFVVNGSRRVFSIHTNAQQEGLLNTTFARDVTREEDLGLELKRTITSTYELLDTLSTGLVIYGPDTRLQYVNHAYAKMFEPLAHILRTNPTMSEVLDELRRHRLLPEMTDFQDFKRRMIGQFTSLTTPYHDLRYLPNGQIFRVITAPHPLGGLIYMFENITERISLETQYNTLIAVQKATLDNLFEGIAVFSSDNRLKLCNPAFCHIWGLTYDPALLGRHVSQLMDDAKDLFFKGGDWSAFKERMIDNITNRSPKSGVIHRLDERVVAFAYAPLPDGANMVRYLDITDTTQVEKALRERNEALEASDQLKSKFVANVSYELRSPLNTVIGFGEILLHDYFGTLNDKQREYTKGILDASKQLLALINSILDLASLEAGHMVLQKTTIHVPQMLDQAIALIQTDFVDHQHTLKTEYAPHLSPIEGDAWQIQQVFYNLMSNAVKFTTGQGTITVRAYENEGHLVVEVQDNGLGIDAQDHKRIFERFERTHMGTHSGVGLGLSLVKNFVTLHNGTVHLTSQPGLGTTITCRFPLAHPLQIAS